MEVGVGLKPGQGLCVGRQHAVERRRRDIGIRAGLKADIVAVDELVQTVEVLHQPQRTDDRGAVELLVADPEYPRHAHLTREQHLVLFHPLQHERRVNADFVTDPRAEAVGQLGTEDHRVIVKVVERALDDIALERDDLLHPGNIEALHGGKSRPVLELQHDHALGVGPEGRDLWHAGDQFFQRLGRLERPPATDLYLALGVDDHRLYLVTEAAHDARRDQHERHAQPNAQHGDQGEKRQPPP